MRHQTHLKPWDQITSLKEKAQKEQKNIAEDQGLSRSQEPEWRLRRNQKLEGKPGETAWRCKDGKLNVSSPPRSEEKEVRTYQIWQYQGL